MKTRRELGLGYPLVVMDNLRYRGEILERGGNDLIFRRDMDRLLRESISLFFDVFLWTFDPRDRGLSTRPFILWDYQELLLQMWDNHLEEGVQRGGWDLAHLKSRDMGVTWTFLGWSLYHWLYTPGFHCLLGSRKEELVDDGTLNSLFGRLISMLRMLPVGMLPAGLDLRQGGRDVKHMILNNPGNGNLIKGESTNPEFGRAGRYSVSLIDEFATWDFAKEAWTSLGDSCDFRLAVYTPKGVNHYSYEHYEAGACEYYNIGWWLHPKKGEGLYYDESGRRHSPWYDHQLKRRSAQEVAQEIDMEFLGSGLSVFSLDKLRVIRDRVVHSIRKSEYGVPYEVLHFPGLADRVKFNKIDTVSGKEYLDSFDDQKHTGEVNVFRVWSESVPDWEFRYIISVDTSEGLLAGDNQVIDVWDRVTRTQAAQYVGNVDPDILGDLVCAIWDLYPNSGVIPEANTFGLFVIKALQKHLKYQVSKFIYRPPGDPRLRGDKSVKLGFVTSRWTKSPLIQNMINIIRNDNWTINSYRTVLEALHYESDSIQNNRITNAAKTWHDDSVMTMALAMEGETFFPEPKKVKKSSQEIINDLLFSKMNRKNKQLNGSLAWLGE